MTSEDVDDKKVERQDSSLPPEEPRGWLQDGSPGRLD